MYHVHSRNYRGNRGCSDHLPGGHHRQYALNDLMLRQGGTVKGNIEDIGIHLLPKDELV